MENGENWYFLGQIHSCSCRLNEKCYSQNNFFGCSFYEYTIMKFCFICFREWYDPHAILMQEEGGVISGLLVGLNIIDCNFDLKGDSLDVWVSG